MVAWRVVAAGVVTGSCIVVGAVSLRGPGSSDVDRKLAVLAASSLSGVLSDDERVDLLFAASGMHYQAVAHGRPFDVLITASTEHAERLIELGVARRVVPLSDGRPVLVEKGFVPSRDPARWIARHPDARIALANPAYAPFGASAGDWLMDQGIDYQSDGRFVIAQSVESAMALLSRGAVDAAFGADVLTPHGTCSGYLPGARPILYWCVVSRDAPEDASAVVSSLSHVVDDRATSNADQRAG